MCQVLRKSAKSPFSSATLVAGGPVVGSFGWPEANSRGARMLRTAFGPAIAQFLEDTAIIEVMLNPDGRLWIDRLSGGLAETIERLSASDGERIVRLVAHHVGAEVHAGRRRTPSRSSIRATALPIADDDTPSCRPATVKLRASAARTKALSDPRLSIREPPFRTF